MNALDPTGSLGTIAAGAIIGGIAGLGHELLNQLQSGCFDPAKLLWETAKGALIGAAFGAGLGMLGEVVGAVAAGVGGYLTADAGCKMLGALAEGDYWAAAHAALDLGLGIGANKFLPEPQSRPTAPGRGANGSQKGVSGSGSSGAGKSGGGHGGAPKAPHAGDGKPPPSGNNGCARPGTGCFLAGTLVLTKAGPKPIEQIQEGDQVLSRDEVTGAAGYKTVTKTNGGHAVYVCKVVVRTGPQGRTERRSVGSATPTEGAEAEEPPPARGTEEFLCTRDHPFWSATRGRWVEADTLVEGERLLDDQGCSLQVELVTWWLQEASTHNFEVADWHTYFVLAGLSRRGVWVHNGPFDVVPPTLPGVSHVGTVDLTSSDWGKQVPAKKNLIYLLQDANRPGGSFNHQVLKVGLVKDATAGGSQTRIKEYRAIQNTPAPAGEPIRKLYMQVYQASVPAGHTLDSVEKAVTLHVRSEGSRGVWDNDYPQNRNGPGKGTPTGCGPR